MNRNIQKIIVGTATQDGAGVKLTRVLGAQNVKEIDPFLMLDAFDSTDPQDYISGFPWHPHRGIETFTYLISGKIIHQDSLGNHGVLTDLQAQWMTAGRGIIHQEMPQPVTHLLGLQLWINLPQAHKMTQPSYWDIKAEDSCEIKKADQTIRLISGEFEGFKPLKQPRYVQARIMDVSLETGAQFDLMTLSDKTVFLYLFEGKLNNYSDSRRIDAHQVALFDQGTMISLRADTSSTA